ncbi:hypothetical protein EXIGLDRAFT_731525 [Exidia glandulosa HHB12029]|uniref:Uncharacterized protein n=1 Tax=Exidia glandulosa HHB12029 TaxID=1314781 RepID=A0A165BUL7_EXIGL|nr:hypothetical protein EXIGLDRAFT_731525 [Exidia glandulosa HHB12029]
MPKHRYSNYYAHPKKTGAPRKPRAPPKKKLDYEDDAEIVGLLPDDARLDLPTRVAMPPKARKPRAQPKKLDDAEIIGTLPDDARLTRTSPMKFKNGTNVFKFDFEAPLAFPRRPLGMSLEEMFKAIVDGDEPAQTTTTTRKRQRDAEEDSDTTGHDADDEKDSARKATGTKRRKLRV